MKNTFSSITPGIAAVALMLSATVLVNAQNREKFVISAKAGGVNAISGRTEVKSTSGANWELLNVTDDLKAGDIVKTGPDGRLEVLLNPGSFLRVAGNSEFELTDNSLENLEVKLIRGTAIVEATGAEETPLAIGITTPHAKMLIVTRGLYRVNVKPGDTTELFVRKGRVVLGNSQTKIKAGYKVVFTGTTFNVAKLDKRDNEKDYFEDWSKQRAGTVALVNRRIQTKALNSFLYGYNDDWAYGGSFLRAGIWLFSSRANCWTFLPFYFGWGSPYGSSYSCVFYNNLGYRWGGGWNPGNRSGGWTGASGSGSGSRKGSGSGGGSAGGSGSGSGGRVLPPNPPPRDPQSPSRNIGRPDINPDSGRGRRLPPHR